MTDLNTAKINSLVQDVQQLRVRFDGFAFMQEVIEARLKALEDAENYRQQDEDVERALAPMAQPEPQRPGDEELLELMPKSMRDRFSYAAWVCSDATGAQINSVVFRTALNLAALEYARAVLDHWGSSASKGD